MHEQPVSQDRDDEIKDLWLWRVMSEADIAEMATGPVDCQDRYCARRYEVTPSTSPSSVIRCSVACSTATVRRRTTAPPT